MNSPTHFSKTPLISPRRLRRAIAADATAPATVVETHISWVILTDDLAYKIKKPVRLPFLDFSTLELRKHACDEELRLNRRFAPDLYLDVVPIRESESGPMLEGDGAIVEWAVKMRRFPQTCQLDHELAAGALDAESLERFAASFARLQSRLPVVPLDATWGEAPDVILQIQRNFDELDSLARDAERQQLATLRTWCQRRFESLRTLIATRKTNGKVREGHGDLHLANLTRWNGTIIAFDGIEFAPELRWIDVIADIAFLVMDLERHGRADLSHRFLDAWLSESGDWEGLRLLPLYAVHRALVRAKVAMIRRGPDAIAARTAAAREAKAYLKFASRAIAKPRAGLILMHGLSGSGKSIVSATLCASLPALRVRSDIERRRLYGLNATEPSGSSIGAGLYAEDATTRTYDRLLEAARAILDSGETVIVDAAFLEPLQRVRFVQLGEQMRTPVLIIECRAPEAELRRRLALRACTGDPSEADARVLEWQLRRGAGLAPHERARTLSIDSTRSRDPDRFARNVRHRLDRL